MSGPEKNNADVADRRFCPPGTEGTLWGGFLSRRPECSPSSESGGPGKEVPPERARTNQRIKDGPLAGGMPERNTETCFDTMVRIRLPLAKTIPTMHSPGAIVRRKDASRHCCWLQRGLFFEEQKNLVLCHLQRAASIFVLEDDGKLKS
jgi:hypothetical protein